jgi:GxxExxY protein
MGDFIHQDLSYQIIGLCMEIHNNLGGGFSEVVYKDALEWELKNAEIPFEREKEYRVNYKGFDLPHQFYADFVVFSQIIIEVKGVAEISDKFIAQCLNYLKVSDNQLALLINFGESRLNYKRVLL